MSITRVVVRRRVADLDAAVPFYEGLTGAVSTRFALSGAQLAAVGPFLLFAAPDDIADRLERVVATITADDVAEWTRRLQSLGAEIVAPATATPNGQRLVARHPDGSVFEYVSS